MPERGKAVPEAEMPERGNAVPEEETLEPPEWWDRTGPMGYQWRMALYGSPVLGEVRPGSGRCIGRNEVELIRRKVQSKAVVVDIATQWDANIRKKGHEKLEEYQGLKDELEKAWSMKLVISTINIIKFNENLIFSLYCRQLHSPTNLILLSLAVSDFLIGLVVIPMHGLLWGTCWFFGDLLCASYFLIPLSLTTGSVGTIVLISVDRYIAIIDPLHYSIRMTDKVINRSICFCWFYAFMYASFTSYDSLKNPSKYKTCLGECRVHFSKEADIICVFVIPVLIILVLYTRVFVVAMSQARIMRSQVTSVTCKASRKSEIKAAKNLGIVVLVYLLCFCPYYCVAYSGFNLVFLGAPIEMVMLFMVLVNSCLNPLMYAMLYPWFRKTIELIVTLKILRSGSRDFMVL
ncbi:trace amine-associated receptor 7h-like [Eucyclogobius newberryi]|uniref:trace amine-associated receptor 7h-like n=1 Tax=Eucyclogobius newberryi TaxID=166745 RepID=UPI003B5CEE22